MTAKIVPRLVLRHRKFLLAVYEENVRLCSVDRRIQPHLNNPLARILINAHSIGFRALSDWLQITNKVRMLIDTRSYNLEATNETTETFACLALLDLKCQHLYHCLTSDA